MARLAIDGKRARRADRRLDSIEASVAKVLKAARGLDAEKFIDNGPLVGAFRALIEAEYSRLGPVRQGVPFSGEASALQVLEQALAMAFEPVSHGRGPDYSRARAAAMALVRGQLLAELTPEKRAAYLSTQKQDHFEVEREVEVKLFTALDALLRAAPSTPTRPGPEPEVKIFADQLVLGDAPTNLTVNDQRSCNRFTDNRVSVDHRSTVIDRRYIDNSVTDNRVRVTDRRLNVTELTDRVAPPPPPPAPPPEPVKVEVEVSVNGKKVAG